MKKFSLLLILSLTIHSSAFTWGQNGHRIVGKIAETHLTKKARKNIARVLGNETLAEVSTYMDFIKSDNQYRHMNPWHYATIPDGQTYEQAGTPEEGDVIVTLRRLVDELKTKKFTDGSEAFALKCLVHLVGDIHQPLHVGNGNDRGGNDEKVEFFWENSNLHRVWDTQIIENQNYSYTEYVEWINHPSKAQVKVCQSDTILEWAYESMSFRDQVYDLPEDKKISYRYIYDNRALVNQRLLQAGVRLAGILNEIYG
jgi:hypothetical protein